MQRSYGHRIRHAKRSDVNGPVHVTLKLRTGLPSLRTPRAYRVLERAFRRGNERQGFRLVHYSVLSNHLHLFVDVRHKQDLARGMQGLAIRIARGLNRHWRRKGTVFFDRYHARVIEPTVRQIKRALRYVLQNARRHGLYVPKGEADPFSSARWFSWFQRGDMRRPLRSPPVVGSRCPATDVCLMQGLDIGDLPGRRLVPFPAGAGILG